jgi:hypothetical protein
MIIIIGFSIFASIFIYDKFKNVRDKKYNSPSLEVTYHSKNGKNIDITKVTPVTDYVGLSSYAYKVTIKNNTNKRVKYQVKLIDNDKKIAKDDCADKIIPKSIIKVGIHKSGEVSKIINLDDIDNDILTTATLGPKKEEKYTVRVWISNENDLVLDKNLHYHGILKITE